MSSSTSAKEQRRRRKVAYYLSYCAEQLQNDVVPTREDYFAALAALICSASDDLNCPLLTEFKNLRTAVTTHDSVLRDLGR